jgi:DNA polymerase elongation subunit (family B)
MYQDIYYDNFKNKVHIWDDVKGHIVIPYKKYAYKKDNYGTYVSLYGDKLKKIYKFDKKTKNLWESDVNPETRVLVDTYTNSDDLSINHRLGILDIEVEVTQGFPDIHKAENKITAVGYYDDITDKYFCLVLDSQNKVTLKNKDNIIIEKFENESQLLHRFYAIFLEHRPTILTGWNSLKFDIPYLYNRAVQVLGSEIADCLSPIRRIHWSEYQNRYKIAGLSQLDYLSLYKKFTFTQKTSYRLDAIAQDELGETKVEYEGTLNDLYENDINKFIEYNIHDVRLVKMLNEKLDFIDVARGIAHVGHCPYEEVEWSSRYLEGAVLVYLKKLGIVAPNRSKGGRKDVFNKNKFSGAYVQDPQKGRHEWIYDLDITSMYPSIIMSLNISPETKIGKIEGWNSEEFVSNIPKTYSVIMYGKKQGNLTNDELKMYFNDNQVSISSNGIIYKTDKKGLIPALLEQWFNTRVEYRKLAKKFSDEGDEEKYQYFNRRQYIQKVILNSLYGVLGLSVFRFYDLDNAEATTLTGQSLIKFTKKIGNHFYNKELSDDKDHCIYIDTDSVFFSAVPLLGKRFPNEELSDVMKTQRISEIATEVQGYMNSSYDYFAKKFCNIDKHRFEIKQEIIARTGFFVVKKRYGMRIINDNGVKVNKVHVKGLDTVRSTFAPAMKTLLSNVLEDILNYVPKDKVDTRILNFKKSITNLSIDDIANPVGVKNIEKYTPKKTDKFENVGATTSIMTGTPVHVKASIYYNDLLKYFKKNKYEPIVSDSKMRWVYLKDNPFKLDVVGYKGHEDPKEIMDFIKKYINYDKMYEQALTKKLNMFYGALEWSKPQIRSENSWF